MVQLRLRPTRDCTRAGGFTPRSTMRTLLACTDIGRGALDDRGSPALVLAEAADARSARDGKRGDASGNQGANWAARRPSMTETSVCLSACLSDPVYK